MPDFLWLICQMLMVGYVDISFKRTFGHFETLATGSYQATKNHSELVEVFNSLILKV